MHNAALLARLPTLLPKAIAWAEATAELVAQHGQPLHPSDVAMAQRIGISQPELVRIAVFDQMPWPEDAELRAAGEEAGLFGPNISGLTLGHSVLLVNGRINRYLVAHELRHVHQYEVAGSIAVFLPRYLAEVATLGYTNAPSEIDARAFEHHAAVND